MRSLLALALLGRAVAESDLATEAEPIPQEAWSHANILLAAGVTPR